MNPTTIIPRDGLDPITAYRAAQSRETARELTERNRRKLGSDTIREIFL